MNKLFSLSDESIQNIFLDGLLLRDNQQSDVNDHCLPRIQLTGDWFYSLCLVILLFCKSFTMEETE